MSWTKENIKKFKELSNRDWIDEKYFVEHYLGQGLSKYRK